MEQRQRISFVIVCWVEAESADCRDHGLLVGIAIPGRVALDGTDRHPPPYAILLASAHAVR
jgi:hypothetical protein